uniref:Uncharacterized protein n=1 Tax=Myoviridae sp. ct4vg1 TaxID=2825033 RepID=A0A8S5Q2G5_9CAUD|nr:MAG TPA: hypothetical protein [Myoviridae sp. ct4vg1]DAK32619.1 MAG TPA: hypothetical protein [Caudoviricetes sp.]
MVELAKTDLDKYHFVFKRYISKIKSAYYHAYYNKKTGRQFRRYLA